MTCQPKPRTARLLESAFRSSIRVCNSCSSSFHLVRGGRCYFPCVLAYLSSLDRSFLAWSKVVLSKQWSTDLTKLSLFPGKRVVNIITRTQTLPTTKKFHDCTTLSFLHTSIEGFDSSLFLEQPG